MLNIAAIDNDNEVLELLKKYSSYYSNADSHKEDLTINFFHDGKSFLETFNNQYDLILCDINMPEINGLEVARNIREKDDKVSLVFLTNYAKYAIDGYKYAALDFLLKPISYLSFSTLLNRVKRRKDKYSVVGEYIWVKTNYSKIKIMLENIIFIEVKKHIIFIHTTDGDYSFKGTIKEVEQNINSSLFSKCNSCYIVNLEKIKEISHDTLKMSNDCILTISRSKKQSFLDDLTLYINR